MPKLTTCAERFTPGTLMPETIEASRAWAARYGADNPRTMRYVTLVPWVHPDITPKQQNVLANIYVFYRFYDDFNDSLHNDIHTSRDIANQLIDIIDGHEPQSATTVTRLFADLWEQQKRAAPATFLARTAMHWKHYLAAQSNYHAMRKDDYPWDLQEYLNFRIDNGGLVLAVSQAELANTIYVPNHIYRIPTLVAMRRLAYYCVILTNDLHSALRDEQHDDQRNPVAQHRKHTGATREEAFDFIERLLLTYSEQLHNSLDRLARECDLLELTTDERAIARTAAQNCLNHTDGYAAWAHHNEHRLTTPDIDPELALHRG